MLIDLAKMAKIHKFGLANSLLDSPMAAWLTVTGTLTLYKCDHAFFVESYTLLSVTANHLAYLSRLCWIVYSAHRTVRVMFLHFDPRWLSSGLWLWLCLVVRDSARISYLVANAKNLIPNASHNTSTITPTIILTMLTTVTQTLTNRIA